MAAVVVNHNGGAALLSCVESLRSARIEEIVVVDNASTDGSLAALAAHDATARLLPTGRNLGYGRAANDGAGLTSAALLLICNADVRVEPDTVRALRAVLVPRPDLAIVGPRLVSPDGVPYPSARAFPSFTTAAGHAVVGLFHPDNPWTRRYRMAEGSNLFEGLRAEEDVDWVSGACFLARREAFDSVGGFDERYFMYVEDLDLCWRLRRAGWAVRFVPGARVVHDQGSSTRRHPWRMLAAHHRSTWQFAETSLTGAERMMLPAIAAGLAARYALAVAREWSRRLGGVD
ncbi:MAG TPA: glycosyltransferase family 2 protein [Acidimicrobiales bacterium]|nr:glycosyltransferase family 2 protein [Acidimicrobiales bacterium]